MVKRDKRDELTKHLNYLDITSIIKFMDEPEMAGSISFLDVLISHKGDGKVKVQVYCKATHTDQYLNFSSNHPLNHKLSVICNLYDLCDNIVTEEADAAEEIDHVKHALGASGYPSGSFKIVREQMDQQERKNNRKINKKDSKKCTKIRVTLPYVRGV